MKSFGKNSISQPSDNKVSDKAANWIAQGIIKLQHFWVKGMQILFAKLSPRQQKIVVFSCFLTMLTYCCVLTVRSVSGSLENVSKPVQVVRPSAIGKGFENTPEPSSNLKRIEKFKNYLDSLGSTAEGRKIRDSLLKGRPGLLDSIRAIGRLYSSK